MSILQGFAASASSLTRRSIFGPLASFLVNPLARLAPAGLRRVRPHSVVVVIGGWRYLIDVWSDAEWAQLAEDERPDEARRLGDLGWIHLYHDPSEPSGSALLEKLKARERSRAGAV